MSSVYEQSNQQLLCDLFYYSSTIIDNLNKLPTSSSSPKTTDECSNITLDPITLKNINTQILNHGSNDMFDRMWDYDRNEFMRIAFYLRQHRRITSVSNNITRTVMGRGERKIFYQIITWLSHNKLPELLILLPYIPDYGYWKDLLVLMGTNAENAVIFLFATQLIFDHGIFNSPIPGLISMAAKWTPNEGSSSDLKHNTYSKIAKCMNISKKILRTQYLVPLRRYLSVTEQIVGDKRWSSVNYNMVPQLSLQLHSKTFLQHDHDRFVSYLNTGYTDHIKRVSVPTPMYLIPTTRYNMIPIRSHVKDNENVSEHIIQDDYISRLMPIPQLIDIKTCSNNDIITILGKDLPITNHGRNTTIEPNSSNTIRAIDISGSMAGFPITLAGCMCVEANDDIWIPLDIDNSMDEKVKYVHINKCSIGSFTDRILNIASIGNITHNKVVGYNIENCVTSARSLGKNHLIIISNILLDDSELTNIIGNDMEVHVTYWSINMSPITIRTHTLLTIIEGYDINIYVELTQGHILNRDRYKDIIIKSMYTDIILPKI